MKKNLFTIMAIVAVAFGLSNAAKAQTQIKQVTVNVELKDVIGIGPDGPSGSSVVDFLYETANDYNNDKTVTIPNQFNVTSTKAYNILVKGSGDFIGQTTAATTLPLNILKVSARTAGGSSFGNEVTPTTIDQNVITGAAATLSQSFDVLYKIEKNIDLLTKEKQKYSTQLTYSITAQ
ncbi:MAG TPA: hypothetical protein VK541_01125 [Pedobacter sp.]|uniref:hypothetical protein n=1 Tax=Pedobacter sp. TaxID=1411316 RepID=UPI002C7E7B91|nr:hypothetical protein [Pedobacter sp.]HMI01048.1 hypothetical protein [Pedobacter sp.]